MSEHLPTPEENGQPDVSKMAESELIDIIADISTALTPLGSDAFDEYMRRRGEVLNRAIAEQSDKQIEDQE
ncbi:hypothetical protein E3O44_12595 [Cryobacterium algoricola]|uniref:Uncharacterized protein n=1 Tax=Cryobacterium algoricola TaxID=1259183 RepID=A0ABY2IAI7_9MICO|nr:hypothetical protein [Cryobacterium algoricola]TFB85834.1 hypothetical protein E3O44_12595 [Cryobacterium algoricola]